MAAPIAVTPNRIGAGSHADAVSGTNRSRIPIPAAAPSASIPNIRLTRKLGGPAGSPMTLPVVQRDRNGGPPSSHQDGARPAVATGPRCYTPRVLDSKRVPASGQAGNDSAAW